MKKPKRKPGPFDRPMFRPPCRCKEGTGIYWEHIHTPAGLMSYRGRERVVKLPPGGCQ